MSQYFAVATLLGQAKIAAAVANQGVINITAVAVGDGNGAPVTPVVTQVGLVHELWRGAPTGVTRDPAMPTQVLVSATIPSAVAPATIRELALFTSDGQCIVVANYPATDLAAPSQGAVNTIDVQIPIVVDTAAQVTVTVNPTSLVSVAGMLRAPFIAIDSFVTAPPANPVAGQLHVVNAGGTGAFAGLDNKFVQWIGTIWVSATAVKDTIVGDSSSGLYWKRTAAGWTEVDQINYPLVKQAVATAGIAWTPSNDANILAQAAARYASGGVRGVGGGTGNAQTVAAFGTFQAPKAYFDGMSIVWRPAALNTGPATINAFGLGNTAIYDENGNALAGGELLGWAEAQYDSALPGFRLLPWGNANNRRTAPQGAQLTIWVRTDGNDATADGSANTAAKAFATINAALAYALRRYNLTGVSLTVRLGNAGTYASFTTPAGIVALTIQGDAANQDAYVISGVSAATIPAGAVTLVGVKLSSTGASGAGFALNVFAAACTCQNVSFAGPTANALVCANRGGYVALTTGNKVVSDCGEAFYVLYGGILDFVANGDTAFVGTPSFSIVAWATSLGIINKSGTHTFSGSANGQRYNVIQEALINTFGGGANAFPGSSAGSMSNALYL